MFMTHRVVPTLLVVAATSGLLVDCDDGATPTDASSTLSDNEDSLGDRVPDSSPIPPPTLPPITPPTLPPITPPTLPPITPPTLPPIPPPTLPQAAVEPGFDPENFTFDGVPLYGTVMPIEFGVPDLTVKPIEFGVADLNVKPVEFGVADSCGEWQFMNLGCPTSRSSSLNSESRTSPSSSSNSGLPGLDASVDFEW